MKYIVKTIKEKGKEKIDFRPNPYDKRKNVYACKDEDGNVLYVDKDWLLKNVDDIVNLDAYGESLSIKKVEKKDKTYFLSDRDCEKMFEKFGNKVQRIQTYCDNDCFLYSKSEKEHLLWIPSNVTELNKPEDDFIDDWLDSEFTPKIQKLKGSLKVIGGSGLVSCFSMFESCVDLVFIDMCNFDTRKVKSMSCMFADCTNLKSVSLSHFDTSNVVDMRSMFYYCQYLESADLSSFDTRKVTDMECMFTNCWCLSVLDLSNFDTMNVKSFYDIFLDCDNLKSVKCKDKRILEWFEQ